MDRARLLTPLAVERVERLAADEELLDAVGARNVERLRARVRVVHGALGAADGGALALAVGDLARDCVTLPEWVERDLAAEAEAGEDFCWTFGPIVAEIVAAALAAAAGLTEEGLLADGSSVDKAAVVEVIEELSRELDCLAPYLCGTLGRADELALRALWADSLERLLPALRSICAWSLEALARALGRKARLRDAKMLWGWGCEDHLWVAVLGKGVLSAACPPLGVTGAPTSCVIPARIEALQLDVAHALCGLASPTVAFASAAGAGAGEVPIEERAAALALHRARLATEVASTHLLCPLCKVASRNSDGPLLEKVANFLAACLQPELLDTDPSWAASGAEALAAARGASAELGAALGWRAREVWSAMRRHPAPTAAFLRDCASIAYGAPASGPDVLRLIDESAPELGRGPDAPALGALCALAANAEVRPPRDGHFYEAVLSHAVAVAASVSLLKVPVRVAALDALVGPLLPVARPPPAAPAATAAPPAAGLRRVLAGAPPELRCGIDGRLMLDPVRAPSGAVFERSSLAAALASSGVCPATGEPLSLADCPRDAALRRRSLAWVREQRRAPKDAAAA